MTAATLPPVAATVNPADHRAVVMIRAGCRGFWSITHCADDDAAALIVAALNLALDVTPPQREALFAGSMFGHDVPAADPASYNDDGSTKRADAVTA